jgi:transcriptional regulator with XRE-family HTH domain
MLGRTRIALNLRRIRAAKGISQEELAFNATVDRSYISGMEREAFNPTIDMLERLAKALAVDVAEFLNIPKGTAAKTAQARASAESIGGIPGHARQPQYSSARMIVSTRVVTLGSAGSGEAKVSDRS